MSDKYPFLDLLKKPLDTAQNAALENINNAVIAAGAGSGKTQVLATRFAWLVMTGQAKADEILTLTFTNKAAAEMYQRIYETLQFFASHEECPELSAAQKKLAAEGLADFANAHIQTLDSYCSNIVRQCSNRYGIRPDFSVGSSEGTRDVKNRALKYTLKNAERPGIQAFAEAGKLQEFSNNILTAAINECANITTAKNYFSSMLPVQIRIITDTLNFYFSEGEKADCRFPGEMNLQKVLNNINSIFEADATPKKHFEYKIKTETVLSAFSDELFESPFTIDDIINNNPKLSVAETCIHNFLATAGTITRGGIQEIRDQIKILKDTIAPTLQSVLAYASQYEAIKDLYAIFDDFLEEVNSSKRQSGNLSFADVSELALKVLIENPDIRQQENNAYKRIMIDEFQDNNGKNRDLLYLLSLKDGVELDISKPVYPQIIIKDSDGKLIDDKRSPDKLFFVGDEKQSIYKFRGADVSVFNELTSSGENKLIPMSYNYRSKPETIKAFNLLFENGKGIFETGENKLDYEAYYMNPALKNGMDLPELTQKNVPFHFCFVNTKKLNSDNDSIDNPFEKLIPADEQTGYFIAKKINELAGESKKWSNFAILGKSRSNRSAITKYLSYFNIPYEVDQFSNIFEDGIINDIYNFLRICVYPSDVNAYAAYLTSPLSGLSENAVEIILSHLTDITVSEFVFDPFADHDSQILKDLENLSANQFQKYINARKFYKENRNLVLQQTLTATLNTLWHNMGYKYETMMGVQEDLCAEHFDMIFELARTCDQNNKSVSWFIDELENLRAAWGSEDSDLDAKNVSYPLERSEAVQIMTIHKSKGLQFEHVFLCGCTDVTSKSDSKAVFYDEETGVSICAEKGTQNYFNIRQSEMNKKQELAEFRRLIYVGITRAIQSVYVMGKWNPESTSKSVLHLFEHLTLETYQNNLEDNYCYIPGKAFDYTNIELIDYKKASAISNTLPLNERRNKVIQEMSPIFLNAETIIYSSTAIPRSCPSALETNCTPDSTSEDSLKDDLRQEAKEEGQLRTIEFTAADFGTLVHAYLEAQANNIPPEEFAPSPKLFKNLADNKILAVKNECIKYCHQFLATQEGTDLLSAKQNNRFFRAEWAFKMFWDKTIWTGSIDLIYENENGTYTIVDYKSDAEINEEKYVGQQNCYRKAAAKMLKVDESAIECKLWFMKSNRFVNIEN